ncbi:MAG: hypothetical protein ACOZCL_00260 [Bacillota bacterium]
MADKAENGSTKYNNNKKLVLLIVDELELEDFQSNSLLKSFIDSSFIALMNIRQAGRQSSYKSKLTIGAAHKLEIEADMLNAVYIENGEKQGQLFYSDIDRLHDINSDNPYKSYIGYIGMLLNKGSLKTCVLGSRHSLDNDRSSMLLAMDEKGFVDMGSLDLNGIAADYNKLVELYKQFLPACSFMVVDIADIKYLEEYRVYNNAAEYASLRDEALLKLGKIIDDMYAYSQEDCIFMIASTYPSKRSLEAGNKLVPVAVFNGKGSGMLYSAGTRRKGIILNTELADFILNLLGADVNTGISYVEESSSYNSIKNMNADILRVSKLRLPVLTTYAVYEIITACIVFLYLVFYKHMKNRYFELICRYMLLSNMAAPLVLLLMSAFRIDSVLLNLAVFFTCIYLMSVVLHTVTKKSLELFFLLSAAIYIVLIYDLFAGANMIKHSVLGYDPIIGARFYGIGNELAGVYIGGALILAGCMYETLKDRIDCSHIRHYLLLYFVVCTLLLGLPSLGANFGAAVSAAAGYFFAFLYMNRLDIRKYLIALPLIICMIIAVIIFIDIIGINDASHIGKLLDDIRLNGIGVLQATIIRKLLMNIKLIKYTIWTKVLLSLLAILLVMFFRPVKILRSIFTKYRYMTAAWIGISAGGIAGLLVNDSGIVMAATAMIFMCYTILMLCMDEMGPPAN